MSYLFEFISGLFQYVYSADFMHFMFSSVENTLLFLAWILVITPGFIYTTHSYKPKDLLGRISRALFWCICIFLICLSPLSLPLYFFYRWLNQKMRVLRSDSKADSPVSPSAQVNKSDEGKKSGRFFWLRIAIIASGILLFLFWFTGCRREHSLHAVCVCISFILILLIVSSSVYNHALKLRIKNIASNYAKQLDRKEEIIALLRYDLSKLCAFTKSHVSHHSQDDFRFYFDLYGAEDYEIPCDVYFVNCYVPVKGIISEEKPFGDYTVYIPFKGECYHSSKTCSSTYKKAVHIYDVSARYRPCPNCTSGEHCTPPEWYTEIKQIIDNNTDK